MTSIGVSGTYDYIVCGGGTSGCVVARRLAEDSNVTVLVIEAGPHSENLENVHMVGGEQKPAVNNRQIKLSRGRFLGGSSGVNGTLCIRGTRHDYDDWGMEGWSGEEFFKYMSKVMHHAETFHPKPWFKAAEGAHGTSGPLHTEPHDMAPISQLLLDSFVSKGLPLDHDMFTTGERVNGCGHAPRTVYEGLRSTAADFVTKGGEQSNLTILVNATVDKVIIEKSEGKVKATGVAIVGNEGTKSEVFAKKEIVVSGGAYCSPNILNRSGIGAREELEKHGIETLVDLPGMGKNLMDHLIAFAFYSATQPNLTTDVHVHHASNFAATYQQYQTTKTGFLSTFPFGAFAFTRLDSRLADSPLWTSAQHSAPPGRDPMGLDPRTQPSVEFFTTECYGGPQQYTDFPVKDDQHAFAMISELFGPRSRGTVTLKSKDPLEGPCVDTNYLADPLDVEVLAEACRFGNEIVMRGEGTKGVVKGSWPPELTHHAYTTREEWKAFVREHATTCYHAAGTCAMGSSNHPLSVLDARLRVYGISGLRVADTSIMPKLHGGHTQMPAYGIGEKAAEMIKEDWGS
ncbi:MAG: hypothetical protein Q9160_004727 [Pyrenula sp. 1 TL-2023]